MKVAFTHNLRLTDVRHSEKEAEFDSVDTVNAIATAIEAAGHEVEKVEVSGPLGKATLKPGEKATGAEGKVAVQPINQQRMRNLYSFFGNLDGRDGLAKDLGMTVAQLDATIEPPVPVAPPTKPVVKPVTRSTMRCDCARSSRSARPGWRPPEP